MKIICLILSILLLNGLSGHAQVYFSTTTNFWPKYIQRADDKGYDLITVSWMPGSLHGVTRSGIYRMDKKGNLSPGTRNINNFNAIGFISNPGHGKLLWGMYLSDVTNDLSLDSVGLIALSDDGKVSWQKGYPYKNGMGLTKRTIVVENDGNIAMIRTDTEYYKLIFERIDPTGKTLLSRNIQGVTSLDTYQLAQLSDNAYVFTTKNVNYPSQTLNCVDSMGNIIWTRNIYANTDTSTGDFYNLTAMDNYAYALFSIRNFHDESDLLVYKIDQHGNITDSKEIAPFARIRSWGDFDQSANIHTQNDFCFFVNYSDSSNGHFSYSEIVKVGTDLDVKWKMRFEKPILDIVPGSCNSIVCSFEGTDIYEGEVLSIKEPDLEEICNKCETTIYPNPSMSDLNIRSIHEDVSLEEIRIWDFSGREVWKSTSYSGDNTAHIPDMLSPGVYICQSTCDNGKSDVKKAVIAK